MTITEPGLSYRFLLRIDGHDLGAYTKIEGLSAKYEVTRIKEGGQNTFEHAMLGRVSYTNVKLTRPVDGFSTKLAAWFSAYQIQLQRGGDLIATRSTVVALNGDDDPVAQWSLAGVVPVSYTGPTFNASGSEVLVEVVEIAHQGFWSDGLGMVTV